MTPAQKLGYKVGDKFLVVKGGGTFDKGSEVTLYRDDGSDCPLFAGKATGYRCLDGGEPGAYMTLSYAQKIEPTTKFVAAYEPFVAGRKYELISKGDHRHWSLNEGEVYTATSAGGVTGITSERGSTLTSPYETMQWELVQEQASDMRVKDYERFVPGERYVVGNQGRHSHWGYVVGQTVEADKDGLLLPHGLRQAYPSQDFFLVVPTPEPKADFTGVREGVAKLQEICYNASLKAGWWNDITTGVAIDPVKAGPEKIALMHSELSEALEGLRKGLMDDKLPHRPMPEVELADVVIRVLDWAGAMGYDIAGAIVEKMEYNASRPDHKVENRRATGGKTF